jgi:hypothetical protein
MSITGLISINSSLAQSAPSTLPGVQAIYSTQAAQFSVAAGTGADQADTKYLQKLILAATPTVLDLTALTDCYGASISFARIKSILVVNTSTTSGQVVTLGYSTTTTNAWTSFLSNPGQIIVEPSTTTNQGTLLVLAPGATGWPVSSTNRLFNLDPGANTISCQIEIVGASV